MTKEATADQQPSQPVAVLSSEGLGPLVPKPPNAEGQTLCHVRWMVNMPDGGWLGAWDRRSFDDYVALTRDARCEFAGWQRRFLCPDEGPGDWQPCTERDAQLLVKRTDYELRPVYAFRVRA